MQVEQKEREQGELEQIQSIEVEESYAYSLFVYAVRSQVTRNYCLRRLRIFFASKRNNGREVQSVCRQGKKGS